VGGHGHRRGAALRSHALEHEAFVIERGQDGVTPAGQAAQRGAAANWAATDAMAFATIPSASGVGGP
jgi:hypothetical protein